jgi:hypothetical protein
VDPSWPLPLAEKFAPERVNCCPLLIIPVLVKEPLVTTSGSAFTDGVRANIRKAHKTTSVFDMGILLQNIWASMEESWGGQRYETRGETVNINVENT